MKQSTKRFVSIIISLIFVVGAIVVYFDFVEPAYEGAQNVKAEVLSNDNFLGGQRVAIKKVQDIISSYEGRLEVQQAVSMALPTTEDASNAVIQLDGLVQSNGLALQSAVVSSAGVGAARSAATSSALSRPLGTLSFRLSLAGAYENFKSFLSELESNIRIFDVTSLIIQAPQAAAKGSVQIYNYDLIISSYYQVQ